MRAPPATSDRGHYVQCDIPVTGARADRDIYVTLLAARSHLWDAVSTRGIPP